MPNRVILKIFIKIKLIGYFDRFKYHDIRGGTTKGLSVILDTVPSENFVKLQNLSLDKKIKTG